MLDKYSGLFIILLMIVGWIIIPVIHQERLEKLVKQAVMEETDKYWGDDEE